MLDGVVSAGFKNIVETDDIRLDVGVGVSDRVSHARLSGEVDDDLRLVLLENVVDERLVRKVTLNESVLDRACRVRRYSFSETS